MNTPRYSLIREMDVSNGIGIGVSIFMQGCPFHCDGCFNPETWDYDDGIEYTSETQEYIVELSCIPWINRLSILGGEPLIERNIEALINLICLVRSANNSKDDFTVWLWTGHEIEYLLYHETLGKILPYIDYLVCGSFHEDEKDVTLPFCGSKNQRVCDVKKTLASKTVVLSEYDWRNKNEHDTV